MKSFEVDSLNLMPRLDVTFCSCVLQEKSLYYDAQHGAYYQYCHESQSYQFHSYIDRLTFQTLYHLIYGTSKSDKTDLSTKVNRSMQVKNLIILKVYWFLKAVCTNLSIYLSFLQLTYRSISSSPSASRDCRYYRMYLACTWHMCKI